MLSDKTSRTKTYKYLIVAIIGYISALLLIGGSQEIHRSINRIPQTYLHHISTNVLGKYAIVRYSGTLQYLRGDMIQVERCIFDDLVAFGNIDEAAIKAVLASRMQKKLENPVFVRDIDKETGYCEFATNANQISILGIVEITIGFVVLLTWIGVSFVF